MSAELPEKTFDFVIIGSGFGGSVSAMRLAEKGYSVLVLERGKLYKDEDFAKSNWIFWKYLYNPALRSFGVFQISFLSGMLIMHGAGVGGGSLGYANVLMEPEDKLFEAPAWKDLADWKQVLRPHYEAAKYMLGVMTNPFLGPADKNMQIIAEQIGVQETFAPTEVGVFFGEPGTEGKPFPDPFYGGKGPERHACNYCGGCMIGCRYNAKNTLPKNYLYFAEKWGTEIRSEAQVTDIRPLPEGESDGARYEVEYQRSTALLFKGRQVVRAKNVVLSAGVMGTLKLLFHCRDTTKSLKDISPNLGRIVRTNSEALTGAIARKTDIDYSQGIAIGSIIKADEVTRIEPTRYPAGSGLIRLLAWPLLNSDKPALNRIAQLLWIIISRPLDTIYGMLMPKWAERITILLTMQTEDNMMTVRYKRNLWSLFRKGLAAAGDDEFSVPTKIEIGHKVTHLLAEEMDGSPAGSIAESIFGMPTTAHIMGGCPMGHSAEEGVIGLDCQVFNYPGLYVVDGSIMPANPGINPSLTITALAEYALHQVPVKEGEKMTDKPLGY
ncbi:GMC oxidoreductase [Chloroflexota bacterium]